MPELPEVETIARALREGGRNGLPIIGREISSVDVFWNRSLAYPEIQTFQNQLEGQTIKNVDRRGKFLVISFEQNFLFIHLRMSGDIRVEVDKESIPFQPHDRIVFHFKPNSDISLRLVFNDPRKFGKVWLVNHPEDVIGNLGPEPLSQEFSVKVFSDRLRNVNRQIKPLLLDQTFLAGLGNIYSDEALHLARIHPLRMSSSLSDVEIEELWKAIRSVLEEGIRNNGASIDWVYRGGDFQNQFNVYQREGVECYRCGTKIVKTFVGQRGTHYCPFCQVLNVNKI